MISPRKAAAGSDWLDCALNSGLDCELSWAAFDQCPCTATIGGAVAQSAGQPLLTAASSVGLPDTWRDELWPTNFLLTLDLKNVDHIPE